VPNGVRRRGANWPPGSPTPTGSSPLLILTTFVVTMTLPPEGSGGQVTAIAVGALTAIVALTSSDVRIRRRLRPAAIAAVTILPRVVGASRVDSRTILGAISVYTLIGLLFAFFYLAYGRRSGSSFFTAGPQASDYLFFSYTTLTTTGYGNLVPADTVGQSFAVLEMLMGQIFLVTLVAGLVSLWRPHPRPPAGRDDHAGSLQPRHPCTSV